MALIIADSFDTYTSKTDMLLGSTTTGTQWDWGDTSYFSLVGSEPRPEYNGQMNEGKALRSSVYSFPTALYKTFTSNETVIYISFYSKFTAYGSYQDAGTTFGFFLGDGATEQVGVMFKHYSPDFNTANIEVRQGGPTGTLLGTYSDIFAPKSVYYRWAHFQIKIVIGDQGSVEIKKDGNTVNNYSLTGVKTYTNSNAYVNRLSIRSGPSMYHYVDDLLVYSGAGSAPNDWTGKVACINLPLSNDTAQRQFSPKTPATFYGSSSYYTTGPETVDVISAAANNLLCTRMWTGKSSGNISSLGFWLRPQAVGQWRAAVYTADGPPPPLGKTRSPNTLLGISNEYTNSTITAYNNWGQWFNFDFPTPIPVQEETTYYLALLVNFAVNASTPNTWPTGIYKVLNMSYASGFPASLGNVLSGATTPPCYAPDSSFWPRILVYSYTLIDTTNTAQVVNLVPHNFSYKAQFNDGHRYVYNTTDVAEDIYDISNINNDDSVVLLRSRIRAARDGTDPASIVGGFITGTGQEILTPTISLGTTYTTTQLDLAGDDINTVEKVNSLKYVIRKLE